MPQWHRADLSWADLAWTDLAWADLVWDDLAWDDLAWADLAWPDQAWADLAWADLAWTARTLGTRLCIPSWWSALGGWWSGVPHILCYHFWFNCMLTLSFCRLLFIPMSMTPLSCLFCCRGCWLALCFRLFTVIVFNKKKDDKLNNWREWRVFENSGSCATQKETSDRQRSTSRKLRSVSKNMLFINLSRVSRQLWSQVYSMTLTLG